MSIRSCARAGLAAGASVLLVLCVLGAPTAVQAAPNCSANPDAPACSGPKPKPAPAPRDDVTSEWFTPDWSDRNFLNVFVYGAPESAIAGLHEGDTTRFHASIRCTNGVYASSALTLGGAGGRVLSFTVWTSPWAVPGSCLATVWDRAALNVVGSRVSGSATGWGVVFD